MVEALKHVPAIVNHLGLVVLHVLVTSLMKLPVSLVHVILMVCGLGGALGNHVIKRVAVDCAFDIVPVIILLQLDLVSLVLVPILSLVVVHWNHVPWMATGVHG